MSRMRLQRVLARAGVASRRASEELIRDGRVRVNGRVATLGESADLEIDVVTVSGRRVRPARTVWIALHKPAGYVVTRRDPEGRRTVFELVPEVPGLTHVGRLDAGTSGLLLLTTDGTAAHHLMHPRFAVPRMYRAIARGGGVVEVRRALAARPSVEGRRVALVGSRVRAMPGGALELVLTLREGRNRIVRRLCEQLGLRVERLTRLRYGPVRLGPLKPGEWRYLTKGERAALRSERSA